METAAILSRFNEQGILFFAMAVVIAYLVFELRASGKRYDLLQENFNKYRDDSQKQYMDMAKSQIELTTKTALQIEGYNKTIETLVSAFGTLKEMMTAIKEEFLRSKGN